MLESGSGLLMDKVNARRIPGPKVMRASQSYPFIFMSLGSVLSLNVFNFYITLV